MSACSSKPHTADTDGQEQLGDYRLAASAQCHKPRPARGSGTDMEGAAGSTLLHMPWWKAWLLSCNFPSYQQVMLSPVWRSKEGVFVLLGLVANATRLEAC